MRLRFVGLNTGLSVNSRDALFFTCWVFFPGDQHIVYHQVYTIQWPLFFPTHSLQPLMNLSFQEK